MAVKWSAVVSKPPRSMVSVAAREASSTARRAAMQQCNISLCKDAVLGQTQCDACLLILDASAVRQYSRYACTEDAS